MNFLRICSVVSARKWNLMIVIPLSRTRACLKSLFLSDRRDILGRSWLGVTPIGHRMLRQVSLPEMSNDAVKSDYCLQRENCAVGFANISECRRCELHGFQH